MDPGIILLAAGSSSRMGQSKQLLKVNGETLLAKVTKEAMKVSKEVCVVLGSNYQQHREALAGLDVTIIENKQWERGMGRSLREGLHKLLGSFPLMQAVIIVVCDQPLLTASHLEKLIEVAKSSDKPIVASAYAQTLGVPALFRKTLIRKLATLGDEEGAKKIIMESSDLVASVDFPGGATDLDTMEDFKSFTNG